MTYSAEEIRKNWKKMDQFNMPHGGRYSAWKHESLVAGLCDNTEEVIIVINTKTNEILQEDQMVRKMLPKMMLPKMRFIAIVDISGGRVKQPPKHPLFDTITTEINLYKPVFWELVESYPSVTFFKGKKEPSTVIIYNVGKEHRSGMHIPVLIFSCLEKEPFVGMQYGFYDEPKPRYEKFLGVTDVSLLIEKALELMKEWKDDT